MSRFAGHEPVLSAFDAWTVPNLEDQFWIERLLLNQAIESTIASYSTSDLLGTICYKTRTGQIHDDTLGIALARMFTHQHHHQFRWDQVRPNWSKIKLDLDCVGFF
jgi:hypothetical protein